MDMLQEKEAANEQLKQASKERAERAATLEDAFLAIKQATGVSTLDEMVEKFLNQGALCPPPRVPPAHSLAHAALLSLSPPTSNSSTSVKYVRKSSSIRRCTCSAALTHSLIQTQKSRRRQSKASELCYTQKESWAKVSERAAPFSQTSEKRKRKKESMSKAKQCKVK